MPEPEPRGRFLGSRSEYKGQIYPGAHGPSIDPALFAAAQPTPAVRRMSRANGARATEPSLLGRLLFDQHA